MIDSNHQDIPDTLSAASATGHAAPVTPTSAGNDTAMPDDASAPGTQHAPGLVRELAGTGDGESPATGAGGVHGGSSGMRGSIQRDAVDQRKSSELLNAEAALANFDMQLSPEEERDIHVAAAGSVEEEQAMRAERQGELRRQAALRQAKAQVNSSVPVEQLVQRPSFAAVTAVIEYQTREAYAFILGRRPVRDGERITIDDAVEADAGGDGGARRSRRGYYIAGLFNAASAVRKVAQGHLSGCPYATWYLVRIEQEIAAFRTALDEINAEIDADLAKRSSIRVEPLFAKNPAVVTLNFRVAYAFQFADMLTYYDNIIRKVKAYYLTGFMTFAEFSKIERRVGTPLRRLFKLPEEWYFVGRDAVLQRTGQVRAAEHKMGVLPEEILSGELKPVMRI
jgi:hypothetical protein